MTDPGALSWLREQVQARLAQAKAMLDPDWGDKPWAVTECSNECSGFCPCIVYQGEHKPAALPQVPPIRYVADAETPEIAQWIALNDPQDVIARCEAELAAIGLFQRVISDDDGQEYWSDGWSGLSVARHGLRFIACGHKHREGYAEHWGQQ